MELVKKHHRILVACHIELKFARLGGPYKEVSVYSGETKPRGYKQYVSEKKVNLLFPEAWSEIQVFMEMDNFTAGSKVVGLQHYRRLFCFSEYHPEEIFSLPFTQRNQFAKIQASEIKKIKGEIVIPKKWEFPYSAWEQFIVCKPELEGIFSYGLQELDTFLEPYFGKVDSQKILQENNYLYPLNMFIGKREFYLEWREILTKVVTKIENIAPQFQNSLTPRWGGYLAERYFSVYIYLCMEKNRWLFVEKPVAFFENKNDEVRNTEVFVREPLDLSTFGIGSRETALRRLLRFVQQFRS